MEAAGGRLRLTAYGAMDPPVGAAGDTEANRRIALGLFALGLAAALSCPGVGGGCAACREERVQCAAVSAYRDCDSAAVPTLEICSRCYC